jgi:hypothetical protein
MLPLALLFAVQLTPETVGVRYQQPQLTAHKNMVALTFGASNAIYFSSSSDQGRTFSTPVKVADNGVLALGRHRGPRVAITDRAIVVSAVVGQKGGGADGDLTAWRSADGGKTWSEGVRVNDVPGAAREGLHAMAAGPDGLLFAIWLDLRTRGTKLYGAASTDGGATWSKNRLIYQSPDGHICECCHPSVQVGHQGRVYVMWRNWLAGARDMYLAVSSDGGKTFRTQKLGQGSWPLNACPMDGGGLALNAHGSLVSIWRREHTVFAASPGEPEKEIGAGKDPAIAMATNGGVYAAWSAPDGLKAIVPGNSQPLTLAPHGAFVSLAGAGPVLAAWEDQGSIVIESLP